LLFARGEKEDALAVIEKYLRQEPLNADVRLLELSLRLNEMSPERVILALKDFFFENPENERAAQLLVSILMTNGDFDGARAIVTHFGEVSGGNKKSWLLAAQAVFAGLQGNLASAEGLFSEALLLNDRWDFRYNRSVVRIELGKLKEAEEDLKTALIRIEAGGPAQDNRLKALVHAGLASVSLKRGDTAQAAQQTSEALVLDPKSAEAFRIRKQLAESP